jgi:NAD+ diphosphatase
MIGFIARWRSGEISVQDSEILEAGWYDPEALPEHLPGPYSIARRLIEAFRAERSAGRSS